jgi:amino acid adenylation domain-containing protein/non-ribosomal peptide synthase protein (TIGR01720 family)
MSRLDDVSQKREHFSSAKKALLEKWTRGKFSQATQTGTIARRPTRSPAPLSFAQQRLWFLEQLVPYSSAYNVPGFLRLSGRLNVKLLERSIQQIVRRHDILRTTIEMIEDHPMQIIASISHITLPLVDLREIPEAERETLAHHLADEEVRQPFDLGHGPLLRIALLRSDTTEHILLLTFHHIISDGWSINVFLHEMVLLYQAFTADANKPPVLLPELPIQFADFAVWQREYLLGKDSGHRQDSPLDSQQAYWQRHLSGANTVLELPADYPRPAVRTFKGASQRFVFPEELRDALQQLGRSREMTRGETTLFMTLVAAFAILIFRYTGQDDILIGTPIAGRTRPELERLIGFFANTLVLRIDLSGNPSFRELLGRVREVTLDAYTHQDLPFEKLVEILQPERGMSHTPLFQVMLTLENTPQEAQRLPGLALQFEEPENPRHNLTGSWLDPESESAKFDLWLLLTEDPAGLIGKLEYSTDLFEHATIARFIGHFQTLLESIVKNPEQTIAMVPLLGKAEHYQQLVLWNDTHRDFQLDLCLHHLFEQQVRQNPDALAVICPFVAEEDWSLANPTGHVPGRAEEILSTDPLAAFALYESRALSYHELNLRANQVAHHLQSLGVGPEVPVGICMERSFQMIICLLGILKAGGAYVPLDPTYPQERLTFITQDAHVPIVLTVSRLQAKLPQSHTQVICLDTAWAIIALESPDNPSSDVLSGNLIYVIYTSGSTGKPKGAMLPHRGIVNRLLWMQEAYRLTATDRVLQKTSFSFDVSVWELFWPLISGSSLVMAQPEGQRDSFYLATLIAEQSITTVHFVPSMLHVFLEESGLEACRCLRHIMSSGEALPLALQRRFFEHFTAELSNLYGPTEASIDVTAWACERVSHRRCVPIGHPIANIQIYLLDTHMQAVPIGATADLYIGGTGLARGYLGRPDLTAERFVPNPFMVSAPSERTASQRPWWDFPETRLYRTGDRARYLSDGTLEFLGRDDEQVKLRGFRIEPREIEAVLSEYPGIAESVVLVREDAEGFRLVGYLLPTGGSPDEQQAATQAHLSGEQVAHWQQVFDDAYREPASVARADFNTASWKSSYTGQSLPEAAMREWVAQTVERVRLYQPQRVLEIGCGMGLLLFALAPDCVFYLGTDVSSEALRYLRHCLAQADSHLPQVALRQQAAHDLAGVPPRSFDLVLLNSVIQYFPGIAYLLQVLAQALDLLSACGTLFVGDVRSLPLLEVFHSSVELERAPGFWSTEQVAQRVHQRVRQEQELLLDPAFFLALPQLLPQIGQVCLLLKRGRHLTELTRFRYDVVLRKGRRAEPATPPAEWIWQPDEHSLAWLEQRLRDDQPERLVIKHIANARLLKEVWAWQMLERRERSTTVADLRQAMEEGDWSVGIDPEDLWELGEQCGYRVQISWSENGRDGSYDAFLERGGAIQKEKQEEAEIIEAAARHEVEQAIVGDGPLTTGERPERPLQTDAVIQREPLTAQREAVSRWSEVASVQPWAGYANYPLRERLHQELLLQVRAYLKQALPEYMLPSSLVVLDRWPLTPNGKLDRQALPAPLPPIPALAGEIVAPRTRLEETLADIWASVLGLEHVGVTANFFEMGGDSIRCILLISRARRLGLHMTARQLFQYQTIAELAEILDSRLLLAEDPLPAGPLPLTPLQSWFFEQNLANPQLWQQGVLLEARTALDARLLEQAVQQLLGRHEGLRLHFVCENATRFYATFAATESTASFTRFDVSALSGSDQDQAIKTIQGHVSESLNITEGPLLRVAFFHLGPARASSLFLVIHTLLLEFYPLSWLVEELQDTYLDLERGGERQIAPGATVYQQWVSQLALQAQSETLRQELPYWLAQSELRSWSFPLDDPEGWNSTVPGLSISVSLSVEETHTCLQTLRENPHLQVEELLLTALACSVTQWTGLQSLHVTLDGHDHATKLNHSELSEPPGQFTPPFPLLLSLVNADQPVETLKSIRKYLHALPNGGRGYSLLRYLSEESEVREQLRRVPQPDISLRYLGQLDQEFPSSSPFRAMQLALPRTLDRAASPSHHLEITSFLHQGQFWVEWVSRGQTFSRRIMERLAADCLEQLRVLLKHAQHAQPQWSLPSDFPLARLDQHTLEQILRTHRQIEDIYPLSPLQAHMLSRYLRVPEQGLYFMQSVLLIQGPLDLAAFERAWQEVVARHALMRTGFVWEGLPTPVQIVYHTAAFALEVQDWSSLSPVEEGEHLEHYLHEVQAQGLELTRPTILRVLVARLSERTYRFVYSNRYLNTDGWSLTLLVNEVLVAYRTLVQGQEPRWKRIRPYQEYLAWLERQDMQAAEAFWRRELQGFRRPGALAARIPGNVPGQEEGFTQQRLFISVATTAGLEAFARHHHLTLNTLLQGAWAILMSCYSGEEDILFGVSVSGRPPELEDVESIVGVMMNNLPARVQVSPEASLVPWLHQLQNHQVRVRQYEYTPLQSIYEWQNIPAHEHLFESYLVVQNFQGLAASLEEGSAAQTAEQHPSEPRIPTFFIAKQEYPLRIDVFPREELEVIVSHYQRSFTIDTARTMLRHIQMVLESMLAHPSQQLKELRLLLEQAL